MLGNKVKKYFNLTLKEESWKFLAN